MYYGGNINTTSSVGLASTVLGKKCEETKKNMDKLAKSVYKTEEVKMETVSIPKIPGLKDDVITAELNGVKFYFLRGDKVKMPVAVANLLRNCGYI